MHERWDPTRFIPPKIWAAFVITNVLCFFVFMYYKDPGMMIWHILMMLFCGLGYHLSAKDQKN